MSTSNVQNIFSRILFLIGAVLFSAVFFVVGATAFLILLGLAVFAFLAMSLRMWWLRRQFAKNFPHDEQGQPDIAVFLRAWQQQQSNQQNSGEGRIVEGEIVDDEDRRQP
ncbi:MAG TPA: hypothetical protein VK099_06615 [Alcanivoracaceae bacterium]|nr:hypothetical protein [Alcanivoracaceae bacterium]